ncbi:MAG: ATP-grasp domain-containing protein [Epsilonproteobacteria bacterium]|nr:ATP-grasp domain-containing protein [Campylobacterota bacterium]
MGKINVLITSAGRRVSLVKNFQKHAKVFTCDMNPFLSAASQVSDKFFKVPRVTDESYLPTLLDICLKNDIKIIVPTIDTELGVLARAKKDFLKKGVLIAVSDEKIVDTFALKTTTEEFFLKHGFKTPKIVKDLKNANYPLFAKLDNSSLSVGARRVDSYEEAKILKGNYVFQEYIEGIEYTIDAFFDNDSNLICAVPRERVEVRCGEVSKAKTTKDKMILDEIKRLSKHLKGAFGTLTIQLFKRGNEIFFIEINPRFGGGYPLSFLAGADYAKFLIDCFNGKELRYFEEWRDNLIMLRYDAEVIVDGNSF